jgi:hypothetical protein
MRDTVAPRSTRVAAALRRLDGAADPALIEKHTTAISGAMLHVLAARRSHGFDIGRDADGFYARPRATTVGPAKELRDLAAACRKALRGKINREEWAAKWAALPDRARSLWRPTIDQREIAVGFVTDGYSTIVPKPDVVLSVIEREVARITAAPASKARKADPDEAMAIDTLRAAYREITGHNGGRVILRGRLNGRLIALGREIDVVFGTDLFSVKDSRRLG